MFKINEIHIIGDETHERSYRGNTALSVELRIIKRLHPGITGIQFRAYNQYFELSYMARKFTKMTIGKISRRDPMLFATLPSVNKVESAMQNGI